MSSHDPLAVLEIATRNQLESMLMEFDGSWSPDSLDEYGEQIAFHPDEDYRSLALAELVKIDLQRTWSAGKGRLVEDYLGMFPALGNAESVSADLIAAEYDARNGVDSDLTLESYEGRFPKQIQRVKQLVSQLMESNAKSSSPKANKEKELGQASIDTSRVKAIRDTNDGKTRDTIEELPVEFGRYRILKELGSGAMGKVYLAHDSQLDRQVALKTPSFRGGDDDDMVTRFYREARAAAKLQHRNICPIFDVGEIDGRHFISMAFVKGRCMSDFIKPGKLPPQKTSAILVQRLAVALGEAHRHNVIHRDLKPANIMIDLKKEPIVMDFGLARQTDAESRVTQSGMAVGTPAYMSPEQVRGDLDDVGPTADIYALGVILYELLSGKLPFRGPIAKVVYGIVNEEPAAPSTIREGIDPELESICAKMMAKDRAQRFRSMEDVALALKAYVKGRGQTKKSDQSSPKASIERTSESSTKGLTETGALNAFFAAQADATASGTKIEPALQSIVTKDSKSAGLSARPRTAGKSSGDRRRRFNTIIASGFVGGIVLLLAVVIYFNGGKVELDQGTDAVVEVREDGSLLISPSPPRSTPPSQNQNQALDKWQELIDPELSNWVRYPSGSPVAGDWRVSDGILQIAKVSSGDIRTKSTYGDFEIQFEWKLGKNGNSGVIYRVAPGTEVSWRSGPEYQLLDEFNFTGSLRQEQRTGAIYGLFPPLNSLANPIGQWNQARIIARGPHIEHWLNGTKVAEAEIGSPDWAAALRRNGRLDDYPDFGKTESGYIVLQSLRSEIAYRNIRLRKLDVESPLENQRVESSQTGNIRTNSIEQESASVLQSSEPADGGIRANPKVIDPDVELLNEWEHGGGHTPNWHLASLSPDGDRVAFRIGDGPLQISDSESKQMMDIPTEMEDAISIAFSSDGRLIATGHGNKKIRLWDANSFAPVGEPFESPIEQRVLWVHLSADGSKLIAMGNDHTKLRKTSTFSTWDIPTRKKISQFQADMAHQLWSDSIDASSDGRLVAVISLRNGPTLWDTTTGKNIPVEFEYDKRMAGMMRMTGMDLSADGSRLAYGTLWGGPSYTAILDTSTGKELWRSGRQSGRVHCVQFTNDGKWLASTAGRTKAHQLSLWNVATGSEMKRWTYDYDSDSDKADLVKFLSFSDDGSRLMLAGGHMPVVVWNVFDRSNSSPLVPTALDTETIAPLASGQAVERPMEKETPNSNAAISPPSKVVQSVATEVKSEADNVDADIRAAAQRILDVGGRLGFVESSGWKYRLPESGFRVNNIEFVVNCEAQDADMQLLTQFPDLETLTFWEGNVTDTGFKALAKLRSLKTLRFHQGCAIGDQGLAAVSSLDQLEALTVFHTNVTDDGLKVLADMSSLNTLMVGTSFKQRFGSAPLTDNGLVHLQGIANLTELSVVGPLWTDAAAEYVGQLPGLESLTFGSPTITDAGIEPLGKLQKLQSLTLLTPDVSDEAVTRLRGRLPVKCRFTDKRDKDKYENES